MELEDGTRLFYRAWRPETPTEKVMLMFHRGHEHSGRLEDVVHALGLGDVAVFAWDARGHGQSDGDRGYAPGFACMVKDLDTFAHHVCAAHGFEMPNLIVLAHSVGAVTATTWVHDYAPPIRALVIATPAFKVKLYIPLAIPALRLLQWMKRGKKSFVKSYVKAKMLTHDAEQAKRYDDDPLIARAIAVNVLLDMHDTSKRVVADAGAIRVPTLLLYGGSDWVVSLGAQRRFFANLGSTDKRIEFFPEMYHDILHEKDRHLVIDKIRDFVESAFNTASPREPLLDADQRGYTFEEHARLSRPLTPLSPKWFNFGIQSLVIRTVARLSRGIRLGRATGFDSGQTLDYVYDNEPAGSLLIGKWIDRIYLGSVGWRGIRQRKVHVEKLLLRAISSVADGGRPVRLLDVATGAGRYVLDALCAATDVEVEALLRDVSPANLEVGRALAAERKLENVRFERGDAFDEDSVAGVDPEPNVAIVSGLHELFPSNDAVSTSLRGVARALRRGVEATGGTAYLVYTGQPWHPQLEMIARVLVNREGDQWVMRRRTQEEMDDLVREAGFKKIAMEIDGYGIFTVSLAELRAG
ncbi:MAG: hypothetical protein CMJ83_09355 [Planctomycetes bacterium]|nr:hypothetical protein [Planctomycetota bacterium]